MAGQSYSQPPPTSVPAAGEPDKSARKATAPVESDQIRPTAAILLHGVAGNFYTSSTLEPLIPRLQALGLDVLAVNTRGHDSVFTVTQGNLRRRLGAAYEIVDDCRHDVAAWIEFLLGRGHPQIVLIGHSLGAIKALYAQAQERFPAVAAVIAASPPRLSYRAFTNAAESSLFLESYRTAEQMVREGRGEELFTSKFPFPLLITANAYIDKYGPAERYNILRFVNELPCPALFLYGSKELDQGGIAFAGLPEALASLPAADRRQVAVIDGADHLYTGLADKLAEAIENWIAHVTTRPVAPQQSPATAGGNISVPERRSKPR